MENGNSIHVLWERIKSAPVSGDCSMKLLALDGKDLTAAQLIIEGMFLTVFNHYLLEKAVGV